MKLLTMTQPWATLPRDSQPRNVPRETANAVQSLEPATIQRGAGSMGVDPEWVIRNYPYQAAWVQATHHPRREPS